jgi:hypothetical protein
MDRSYANGADRNPQHWLTPEARSGQPEIVTSNVPGQIETQFRLHDIHRSKADQIITAVAMEPGVCI